MDDEKCLSNYPKYSKLTATRSTKISTAKTIITIMIRTISIAFILQLVIAAARAPFWFDPTKFAFSVFWLASFVVGSSLSSSIAARSIIGSRASQAEIP